MNILLLTSLGTVFPQKTVYVKDFGAIGNGKNDDGKAIQTAYNRAEKINGTVVFERNKNYRITGTLCITSNTEGNGSTLVPSPPLGRAIYFSRDGILVSNLNFKSNHLKYININKNNITLKGCKIEGQSYFILLSVNGDNLKIKHSSIINNFKERSQYAIHSISGVSGLLVENSNIYGGIFLANNENKNAGDYQFINNYFTVNYSHLPQAMVVQNDAFYFRSIDGVHFNKNTFNFKDINRGFKFTDKGEGSLANISNFPPNNIYFVSNHIKSNSINGKQLFDFFSGSINITIVENIIRSKGHTSVFEDKTQVNLKQDRSFLINDNTIYFDYTLLFLRANPSNKFMKSIEFNNNQLIYTSDSFKKSIDRISDSKVSSVQEIKFNYLFDIYDYDEVIYTDNKLTSQKAKLEFVGRYTFRFINNKNIVIKNSNFSGGINLKSDNGIGNITFTGNRIDESNFKESIIVFEGEGIYNVTLNNNKATKSNAKSFLPNSKKLNMISNKNNVISLF